MRDINSFGNFSDSRCENSKKKSYFYFRPKFCLRKKIKSPKTEYDKNQTSLINVFKIQFPQRMLI